MVPLGCGLSSGLTATMWLELAAAAVGEWEAALGIKSFLTAIGTEGAEETGALAEAGFRSWVGPQGSNTQWMSSKWGDVFLHETAIARIRR